MKKREKKYSITENSYLQNFFEANMKIGCQIFFISAIMIFAFGGCSKKNARSSSSPNAAPKQVLRLNIASEPQTLDPRKARALADINLVKMFTEGLTRADKDGNPSLALAENVQVSDDGLTYSFTIRPSKWSNGDPITSNDFVYAWKKSLSPTFNSPNAFMLYVIKNAKEVKLGKLPASLLGIETPDSQTLTIKLKHPVPYFFELIQHPIFFPVNKKYEQMHPNWAENKETHLSNGPFKMREWKHHNFIEATPNAEYWDAKAVQIHNLKMYMVTEETGFKMFDSKELNWEGSPFSSIPIDAIYSLKQTSQLKSSPILGTEWIRINIDKSPFQSKKLRRAFGLAINRQDIVDHVTQGNQTPATGIVPITMGLQEKPYFRDGQTEKALELFEEALQELNLTIDQLPEIVLTYHSNERSYAVSQALQQQWFAALGIRVRLEPLESKVYFNCISKQDYTLALGSWFADFNDPINFLEVFKTRANGTNNTNWESPSYSELLETSYLCSDPHERLSYLKHSEQLIIEDMPVIPIYYYTLLFVKDDNLQDVVLTKTGNIDFKWAHLK